MHIGLDFLLLAYWLWNSVQKYFHRTESVSPRIMTIGFFLFRSHFRLSLVSWLRVLTSLGNFTSGLTKDFGLHIDIFRPVIVCCIITVGLHKKKKICSNQVIHTKDIRIHIACIVTNLNCLLHVDYIPCQQIYCKHLLRSILAKYGSHIRLWVIYEPYMRRLGALGHFICYIIEI